MTGEKTDKAISFLIRVGVSVSAIIAITVIAVPIVAPLISSTYTIPAEIKEWGGVIIGFYFGSFITLIGSLLKTGSDEKPGSEEKPGSDKKPQQGQNVDPNAPKLTK
jgi:hypothetical protein